MSLLDETEIPRRTLVLFLVIDTSASMDGSRINALNTTIREFISEIRQINNDSADVQIEIAVLQFSSGAYWVTADGPVEANQFNWTNLDASGSTDFGAACRALNEKLSHKAFIKFIKETAETFAPIIFLFMDGEPTDEWENALAELKQNLWFKVAIKAAFAIGDDVNRDVIKEFTGTIETIFDTYNSDALKKMIKFIGICDGPMVEELPHEGIGIDQKLKELKELYAVLCELNGTVKKLTDIMKPVLETLREMIESQDVHDSQATSTDYIW